MFLWRHCVVFTPKRFRTADPEVLAGGACPTAGARPTGGACLTAGARLTGCGAHPSACGGTQATAGGAQATGGGGAPTRNPCCGPFIQLSTK